MDSGSNSLPLLIPIVTSEGHQITEFESPADWRDIKFGRADTNAVIAPESLVREEHHGIYGRPWVLGRCYFDELVSRGLKPTDRVLDLGCGAGRVGVYLIPFLDSGRYFGVDWHLSSLVAFSAYEAMVHGLAKKQPTLMLDDSFRVDRFGVPFDVVLDFNTSVHLPTDQRITLFRNAVHTCTPGARLFMPRKPKVDMDLLAELGLRLVNRRNVAYAAIARWPPQYQIVDRWYEFVVEARDR
jgi:SAM-dependent methyltransferase